MKDEKKHAKLMVMLDKDIKLLEKMDAVDYSLLAFKLKTTASYISC